MAPFRNYYIYTKRKIEREFIKRWGGYLSEIALKFTYPMVEKKEPHKRFVIYCFQRTGSTLLVDLLNSHPAIHCDGEILLNRVRHPRRWIELRSQIGGMMVYGFKLQPHHFTYQKITDPGEFLKYLESLGYVFIKLKRRNLLNAAISLQLALTTGVFHQSKLARENSINKIKIDPAQILKQIKWMEFNSNLLDEHTSCIPCLEIFYEDSLLHPYNQQITADLIAQYLELEKYPVTTGIKKVIPEDASSLIENIDEIYEYLRATIYRDYLPT